MIEEQSTATAEGDAKEAAEESSSSTEEEPVKEPVKRGRGKANKASTSKGKSSKESTSKASDPAIAENEMVVGENNKGEKELVIDLKKDLPDPKKRGRKAKTDTEVPSVATEQSASDASPVSQPVTGHSEPTSDPQPTTEPPEQQAAVKRGRAKKQLKSIFDEEASKVPKRNKRKLPAGDDDKANDKRNRTEPTADQIEPAIENKEDENKEDESKIEADVLKGDVHIVLDDIKSQVEMSADAPNGDLKVTNADEATSGQEVVN